MPAHDTSVPFEPPWAAWTWGLSHCTDLELCSHRYQHAVRVCALQEDLSSLPYGDLTEVSRTQSSAPQQWVAAQMPTGLKLCRLWLHHIQVPQGLKGPRRGGESQALPSCVLHLGPFLGDTTMGVTPAPLGLGSAWPLSWGHFQFVCHLRDGFWQQLLPHLPGWLVLQRQRLGVQHCGWMLRGPFLLCGLTCPGV